MVIVDARWTPESNVLTIRCDCGQLLQQRAEWVDMDWVGCPSCGRYESGHDIVGRKHEAVK